MIFTQLQSKLLLYQFGAGAAMFAIKLSVLLCVCAALIHQSDAAGFMDRVRSFTNSCKEKVGRVLDLFRMRIVEFEVPDDQDQKEWFVKEREKYAKLDKLIVIDFYADACNNCKAYEVEIKKLSKFYFRKVIILKVNTLEYGDIKVEENVSALPTTRIYYHGELKKELPYKGGQLDGELRALVAAMKNKPS